jgi:hypothetical protein
MRRLATVALTLITAISLAGCKGFDPGEGGPAKPKAQRIVVQVHVTSVPSHRRVAVHTEVIGPGWQICYDSHGGAHTTCNKPFAVTTPFTQTISVHTDSAWRVEVDLSTNDHTMEQVECNVTNRSGHVLADGIVGRYGATCTYFWEPS